MGNNDNGSYDDVDQYDEPADDKHAGRDNHVNVFDYAATEHNEHRVVRQHKRRGDKLVRARDLNDLELAVKHGHPHLDIFARRLIDHARDT